MVQPLDLQVSRQLEVVKGNLQLEEEERTAAEQALSNRLDGATAGLDARVDAVEGNVQQEHDARSAADGVLSKRVDDTKAELDAQAARLDARVGAVRGDLQKEQDARTAADHALSRHLHGIKEEIDGQLAKIRKEIEELEELIAYLEYCSFAGKSPFREILEKCGIKTVEQLRDKDAEQLHNEMSRIAEQEPHYQAAPAVRRRRVVDAIIRLCHLPRAQGGGGTRKG